MRNVNTVLNILDILQTQAIAAGKKEFEKRISGGILSTEDEARNEEALSRARELEEKGKAPKGAVRAFEEFLINIPPQGEGALIAVARYLNRNHLRKVIATMGASATTEGKKGKKPPQDVDARARLILSLGEEYMTLQKAGTSRRQLEEEFLDRLEARNLISRGEMFLRAEELVPEWLKDTSLIRDKLFEKGAAALFLYISMQEERRRKNRRLAVMAAILAAALMAALIAIGLLTGVRNG